MAAQTTVICRYCQKPGHKEHECRRKKKGFPRIEPKDAVKGGGKTADKDKDKDKAKG